MLLRLQVLASENDSHEHEVSGVNYPVAERVSAQSFDAPSGRFWAGLRWPYNAISKGDVINSCVLQVYVYSELFDDANLDIYFQRAAAPAAFSTTSSDISSRDRTASSVPWVADGLGTGWVSADDIKDVLQEVVDDFDPEALAIILKPRTDMAKALSSRSYDFDPSLAAKLSIDYSRRSVSYPATRIAASVVDKIPPAIGRRQQKI